MMPISVLTTPQLIPSWGQAQTPLADAVVLYVAKVAYVKANARKV